MLLALVTTLTGMGLVPTGSTAPPEPAPAPQPAPQRIVAVIETPLATSGEHIRQLAFDGDPSTAYISAAPPGPDDHWTLVFDQPVKVSSIKVITGRSDGSDRLLKGSVEGSTDGRAFRLLDSFKAGNAEFQAKGEPLKAIRIRPTEKLKHPLVIRDIDIQSKPAVAIFRHPVEFAIDSSEAPEMKAWAERAARVCERNYPMICEELASEGFHAPTQIRMTLKNSYRGVAYASGTQIVGSVKYFQGHLDDIGAMVHETTHCVQSYRGRGNPGWLVEGVADYVRFFRYEPRRPRRLAPEQARYDGSYRTTAAFLEYVCAKYDRQTVKKLNAAMRQGRYTATIWKDITGKTVEELGRDWQRSLAQ